jgi:NitT/TauT family transport system substrate-binding protein
MQGAGVDPNSVQFVELPFPDMIPALQNGQIEAAILLEPFLTVAAGQGAVSVLNVASGPTADLPIAGIATTAEFARDNPNTLAAFQRALDRAQAEMGDRATVEQTLTGYTSITPEVAPRLTLGTWAPGLDQAGLQRVSDLMLQYGVLPQPFDVAPLLAPAG